MAKLKTKKITSKRSSKKSFFQETWVYSALLKVYDFMFGIFLWLVSGVKKLVSNFL